jgi:Fe2+ transport system protein FeoA
MKDISLACVKEGKTVHVVGISCDCPQLKRRLTEIGFVGEEPVTVLKNSLGPVLVMVKNVRIGVGRNEAKRIHVREG